MGSSTLGWLLRPVVDLLVKKLEEVEDKADMTEHRKDKKELKDIDEESENPKIGRSSSSRG